MAEDCEDMKCLTVLGPDTDLEIVFHDGMCSAECEFNDQGQTITECPDPLTQECLRYNPTGEFLCLPTCEIQDDCRLGYTCACVDFFCTTSVCVPNEEREDTSGILPYGSKLWSSIEI